jgi:hypothetical protein
MAQVVILRPLSTGDRFRTQACPCDLRWTGATGRRFPREISVLLVTNHSTNILYLLFIVILLNQLLLERKAGEVWDISEESNAISDIGDFSTK